MFGYCMLAHRNRECKLRHPMSATQKRQGELRSQRYPSLPMRGVAAQPSGLPQHSNMGPIPETWPVMDAVPLAMEGEQSLQSVRNKTMQKSAFLHARLVVFVGVHRVNTHISLSTRLKPTITDKSNFT